MTVKHNIVRDTIRTNVTYTTRDYTMLKFIGAVAFAATFIATLVYAWSAIS